MLKSQIKIYIFLQNFYLFFFLEKKELKLLILSTCNVLFPELSKIPVILLEFIHLTKVDKPKTCIYNIQYVFS